MPLRAGGQPIGFTGLQAGGEASPQGLQAGFRLVEAYSSERVQKPKARREGRAYASERNKKGDI